jgi:hypothetical protein
MVAMSYIDSKAFLVSGTNSACGPLNHSRRSGTGKFRPALLLEKIGMSASAHEDDQFVRTAALQPIDQ